MQTNRIIGTTITGALAGAGSASVGKYLKERCKLCTFEAQTLLNNITTKEARDIYCARVKAFKDGKIYEFVKSGNFEKYQAMVKEGISKLSEEGKQVLAKLKSNTDFTNIFKTNTKTIAKAAGIGAVIGLAIGLISKAKDNMTKKA